VGVLEFWVRKGVAGFRCDVAKLVPLEFWKKATKDLAQINPNLVCVMCYVCYVLCVMCYVLCVMRYVLCVMCYALCVMCYVLCVTCYVSCAFCVLCFAFCVLCFGFCVLVLCFVFCVLCVFCVLFIVYCLLFFGCFLFSYTSIQIWLAESGKPMHTERYRADHSLKVQTVSDCELYQVCEE
jgi:hypothetical protein